MSTPYFLIVAPCRSGSTALKLALGPHCLNEIFTQPDYFKACPEAAASRDQHPRNYLQAVLDDGVAKPPKGAKVMVGHTMLSTIIHLMRWDQITPILLVRGNLTDMALSWEYTLRASPGQLCDANRVGEVHAALPPALRNEVVASARRSPPAHPVAIDISTARLRCQQTYNAVVKLLQDSPPALLLTYEQLFPARGHIDVDLLNQVRTTIGLSPVSHHYTPLRKIASEDLWRLSFSNYDHAIEHLAPDFGVPFSRQPAPIWQGILPT